VENLVQDAAITATPLATRNHNRLSVHCPPDLGDIRVDEVRVKQIMLNLLGNACKFTHNGTVDIDVGQQRCEQRDGVLISVTDTGIGMSREQTEKLFRNFTQADPSTTRKFGGSGLGLAISQRLATMMDGRIAVESCSGAGSTFSFWLPREPRRRRPATPSDLPNISEIE
jgi:signal transduction histidine kinase